MIYLQCANCIVEQLKPGMDVLEANDAVTVLGGAALCVACFWRKIEAMKQEQIQKEILLTTLATNLQEVNELKKKF